MDNFQEKMNTILENPEMMEKIMAMASNATISCFIGNHPFR